MTVFSSATVAKLSPHKPVNMEIIYNVLGCQPRDILEFVPDRN